MRTERLSTYGGSAPPQLPTGLRPVVTDALSDLPDTDPGVATATTLVAELAVADIRRFDRDTWQDRYHPKVSSVSADWRTRADQDRMAPALLRLQAAGVIEATIVSDDLAALDPLTSTDLEQVISTGHIIDYHLSEQTRLLALLTDGALPRARRTLGHHRIRHSKLHAVRPMLKAHVDMIARTCPAEAITAAVLCAAPYLRASLVCAAARRLCEDERLMERPSEAATVLHLLLEMDVPDSEANLEDLIVIASALTAARL